MTTTVVNKRASGFKPNANQRYIGRGSLFGNPFTHLPLSFAQLAIARSKSPFVPLRVT